MNLNSANGARRRGWLIAGITILIFIDVVLSGLAFGSARPVFSGTPAPLPTFSSRPSPSPSRSASPTGTATAVKPAVSDGAGPRFLVPESPTDAWRSSGGACGSSTAVIERTSDGGLSWRRVSTDSFPAGRVLALGLSGSRVWSVVAGGAQCTPNYWSTATGTSWEPSVQALASAPYLDVDGRSVQLGQASDPVPCSVALRLAVRFDGSVALLCADGLWSRGASTHPWTKVGGPDVLDLASGRTGFLIAFSDPENCHGVAFGSLPSPLVQGALPNRIGCAAGAKAPVALASAGPVVWLWSADGTDVSQDGGQTWGH